MILEGNPVLSRNSQHIPRTKGSDILHWLLFWLGWKSIAQSSDVMHILVLWHAFAYDHLLGWHCAHSKTTLPVLRGHRYQPNIDLERLLTKWWRCHFSCTTIPLAIRQSQAGSIHFRTNPEHGKLIAGISVSTHVYKGRQILLTRKCLHIHFSLRDWHRLGENSFSKPRHCKQGNHCLFK